MSEEVRLSFTTSRGSFPTLGLLTVGVLLHYRHQLERVERGSDSLLRPRHRNRRCFVGGHLRSWPIDITRLPCLEIVDPRQKNSKALNCTAQLPHFLYGHNRLALC
jgi:hypothetical protein